jgi:drug/metabolite transporter (DMT)-like permease
MDLLTTILFILASVSLNSLAQITWKKGLKATNKTSLLKMMLKPKVMLGFLMFAASSLIWIMILSNVEVSYAFPFLSLSYVITTILSYLVLDEKVTRKRVLGVAVIIIGVIIVGVSS